MFRRSRGLATAVLAVVFLSTAASPTRLVAAVPVAAPANVAGAVDLSGKPVDPFEAAGSKPLVLIFLRTDCPVANRYAPTIKDLSRKYAGEVVMMLVYPDKDETPQNISRHLRDYGYQLPALQDKQHNLVKLGKVEITPEVAVFNGKKELIYHGRIDNWYKDFGRARPAPTTHELNDAIQAALNGGRAAPAPASGVGCYISDLP